MIKSLIMAMFIALFVYAPAHAYPEQKLTASNGADTDYFGYSVDIEGSRVVVGAPYADNGNGSQSGRVYVYTRNNSQWLDTELPIYAGQGEAFGAAVTIEGNTIAVGAPDGNALYIYTYNGSSWGLSQTLTGTGAFGNAVDIDGDTMIVGAYEGLGKVYVYTWNSTMWVLSQELTAPIPDPLPGVNDSPHFGNSVAIDAGTIVIGAKQYSYDGETYTGAAWVYVNNGTNWVVQADLAALAGTDLVRLDFFGESVAIDDNTILVGAERDDGPDASIGAVYVFDRDGSVWSKKQKLTPSDPDHWYFGCSVSLLDNRAIIGAYYAHLVDGREGCVYEFQLQGGSWVETDLIAGSDSSSIDCFGMSVAQSKEHVIVGSFKNDETAIDAGAAYLYEIPQKTFNEFLVNTCIEDDQSYPSIASDPNGNFIIAWDSDEQDGEYYGIYAQRFDAYGRRIGSEFQVNTTTDESQYEAAVDMNASGDFIIAWNAWDSDAGGEDIYLRRYAADGTPLSGEIKINTYTESRQVYPVVALKDDGSFIVIWESFHGNNDWRVAGRVFDASGNPITDEFDVNQITPVGEMSLAVEKNGDFTVAYSSALTGYDVYARQYTADGTPRGNEVLLHSPDYLYAALAPEFVTDGNKHYVLAWHAIPQLPDTDNREIYAQFFDPNLSPTCDPFRINTTTDGVQRSPSIAMNKHGDFVIAWYGDTDGDQDGIFVRQYDRNGQPLSEECQVNTYITDNQYYPDVAMQESGQFVVTWHSEGQDGSEKGVFAAIGPKTWLADFDHDGQIGINDLTLLTDRWLENEPVFDVGPANGEGIVNIEDFAALAEQWMLGL